jgi:tetratricopeptide (TPR) repeat protein
MGYRGKRDLRQIGRALGVSHVLEGTARRDGGKVHVNAQLVDTRTDTGVWADGYDRDLKEAFAIPTQIAQKVAEQLHAKVSAAEKLSIERKPTADLTAFDLYARANALLLAPNAGNAESLNAADLLNQAVARDPSFLQAYCQLAFAHDSLYFSEFDHTPTRLAMAEAAVQQAMRLNPDAGETHLARAEHFYRGYRDYDAALAELEIARQTLPNNARIFQLMGFMQRRQGRWEESTRNLERAAELDPRDVGTLHPLALNYERVRRYAEAKTWLNRALAVEPNDPVAKVGLADVDFRTRADTRPLHQTIESIRATNPAAMSIVAEDWLLCALAERDVAAATEALSGMGEGEIGLDQVRLNRAFVEGVIARMTNDEHKAQLAFTAARAEQEKIVQARPDFGPAWCVLGLIDAALGRKEEALREGRRAVELFPVEKDAIIGGYLVRYFAVIAAWVGEKDLACEQLAIAVHPPSSLSYGRLKLMPFWDPLRGEPCFEEIVNSLAPKEN